VSGGVQGGTGVTSATAPVRVFVGAGSNIEPERHLRLAIDQLERQFGPLVLSSVYRNRAEGFEGADFLNMVIGFTTRETPAVIVAALERLHAQAGRVRGGNAFAPRTLDLDLLLYGDLVSEQWRLPREDVTRYSFVLGPLSELAPELPHPVTGMTMAESWARYDRSRHPLTRLPLSVLGR
jgi:2-amino-4-hydroxy-6-hydroxymethyldihydropteridine diphosphokinase